MSKSLNDLVFNSLEKARAFENFTQRLEELKSKYSNFLIENEIDFDTSLEFQINNFDAGFKITNQVVLESELGKEITVAFSDSFSHLFLKP